MVILMDRAEACREMTFEEEAALYQKEAKAIFEKEDVGCEAPPINHTVRRGMRIIRKALEEITALREQVSLENGKQASEEKTSEWISASERLPQEYGAVCKNVILLMDDGFVTVGWLNQVTGKGYYLDAVNDDVIRGPLSRFTHWMSLPEPPEEGGRGK